MSKITYIKTNKGLNDFKKLGVTLDEMAKDFTKEEKQEIEKERRYYELLMKMRRMREKKGLTQEKLSVLSGVPRTTIAKIEAGNRNVTVEKLMVIADAMGTTLDIRFV